LYIASLSEQRAKDSKEIMAKTKKELELEREIKNIGKLIESKGIRVRREKLSRGHNFKVRSGNCVLTGSDHIFIDKRLPQEQQMMLLIDVLNQGSIEISVEEASVLSDKSKSLLDKSFVLAP